MRCHTASEFEFCVALLSCTLVISSYTNIFSSRWFGNLVGVTAAEVQAPIRDLELAFFVRQQPPVVFPKFEIRRQMSRDNKYYALPCMVTSTFMTAEERSDLRHGVRSVQDIVESLPVWPSLRTRAIQHKAVDYTRRRRFEIFSAVELSIKDCKYRSRPNELEIEQPPSHTELWFSTKPPSPLSYERDIPAHLESDNQGNVKSTPKRLPRSRKVVSPNTPERSPFAPGFVSTPIGMRTPYVPATMPEIEVPTITSPPAIGSPVAWSLGVRSLLATNSPMQTSPYREEMSMSDVATYCYPTPPSVHTDPMLQPEPTILADSSLNSPMYTSPYRKETNMSDVSRYCYPRPPSVHADPTLQPEPMKLSVSSLMLDVPDSPLVRSPQLSPQYDSTFTLWISLFLILTIWMFRQADLNKDYVCTANDMQGSQPGSTKILTAGVRWPSRNCFTFWQYRSAMNSSELPYYDHIFLVFQHKKLTFNLIWGYLETNCILMVSFYQEKWVTASKIRTERQKSEWINENAYAQWNRSFHPYTSWKSEQWGLNPGSWDPWYAA